MIGNGNCGGAFIDGAARIVSGGDAFDDDGAVPQVANPFQVAPGHGALGESGGDVDEGHGTFAGNDDVEEWRHTAVQQKTRQPSRAREHVRKKGKFLEEATADEFLHSVAIVALADSSYGGVDRNNERGKSGDAGAFDSGLGGATAAHQIQLIEGGSSGSGFHIFQAVPGDGGENVGGAGVAGGARGGHFASGVHEAAVADGGEQER